VIKNVNISDSKKFLSRLVGGQFQESGEFVYRKSRRCRQGMAYWVAARRCQATFISGTRKICSKSRKIRKNPRNMGQFDALST
jgi:hypothetical protein